MMSVEVYDMIVHIDVAVRVSDLGQAHEIEKKIREAVRGISGASIVVTVRDENEVNIPATGGVEQLLR